MRGGRSARSPTRWVSQDRPSRTACRVFRRQELLTAVDVDRSQLQAGIPVFIQVDVTNGDVDDLTDQIGSAEAVEHVFVTADGEIWTPAHRYRTFAGGSMDFSSTPMASTT